MHKRLFYFLLTIQAPIALAAPADRAANTVILTDTQVRQLQIETVEAEETDFEETEFALGHLDVIPSKRAVVSSRIPGRITELKYTLGDLVPANAEVARLESRQPGNPPPTVWLTAPISGMVTQSYARLGEPVEPDAEVMEITDLSELHAIAVIPEYIAGKLNPGAKAHIKVPAIPGKTLEGELAAFAPSADAKTGAIEAIFKLANPELMLRPGMRAEFSIVTAKREKVMVIPREAVQGDAADRYVYAVDYDIKNAYVKAPVVLGAQNDRFAEVIQGLFPADEIVTKGAYGLAFAGKGSVSLKEALDAAHGHPHNEDGSEMTEEQRNAAKRPSGPGAAGIEAGPVNVFLIGTNILLLALLCLSLIFRKRPVA